MVLAFGDHRLDIARRELHCGSVRIDVEPQVFDILVFLVQHRDRVVSKDHLLQAVWGGRIVSESALTTRINAARRVLGDSGAAQRLIRTFSRKGFRFVGEVTELPNDAGGNADWPNAARGERPSIAVLPFQNMSGDPGQEHFVDGLVEEIITALSRISWLFVIARNATLAYKGHTADLKRIGCELGVRYVLDGSIRKAGDRVRIAGQLIEVARGTHLWADRFDDSLDDMFALQDKVASSIAGIIEPALQAAEIARSANCPANDLTAYDLYLRAHAMFLASAKQIPAALGLIEQAIERDPHYAPALAWAAICCFRLILDSRSEDPNGDRRKGIDYARRALEESDDDPDVLSNAALALAWFGEDIGVMITLVDRALVLNPNFARGWHISGLLAVWAGHPDVALQRLDAALRLSPRARIGTSANLIGLAHFFAENFDQAVPQLLLAIQNDPGFPSPYRFLAACYAHMGRLDDAGEFIGRLLVITSEVFPEVNHFRNAGHRKLLLSGLRLAVDRQGGHCRPVSLDDGGA